jgi:hypothetical protein
MAKVTKISDRLVKVGECVNVYFYDNALMVEATGRDKNDDWCTVKLMCTDLAEVQTLLAEVETLPRDS